MSRREAPPWAIDLLEGQYHIVLQNRAILAKLKDRSTADQRDLDQLTKILKCTNAKIDNAQQDK